MGSDLTNIHMVPLTAGLILQQDAIDASNRKYFEKYLQIYHRVALQSVRVSVALMPNKSNGPWSLFQLSTYPLLPFFSGPAGSKWEAALLVNLQEM